MFERLRRRPMSGGLQFDPASLLGLATESPNLVAIAVDSTLVFANPVAEGFLGTGRRGELLGRPVLDVIHTDDRAFGAELLARVRETGQAPVWAGVRLIAVDGRPLALEASATPVEFDGERALIIVGIDQTDARRAHAALLESERRYQSLAGTAPVAIYRLDAEGNCVYLNPRWSELTGISTEEALGRSWMDFVPDHDRSVALDFWRRIAAAPAEVRAEQKVRHRNGSTLHVLTQLVPETDAVGRVIGWVGTLTDLTHLKEAELALARSEARLRLALQSASMVSWEADLDSGRIEWSDDAARVLGIPDHLLPRDVNHGWSLISRADVALRSGSARKSLATGEPFELEGRLPSAGAEPRWILVRGQARLGASGEGRRIGGVIADVTVRRRLADERAQLEQKLVEAQRLESLGLLAGGVAHDFNNLLVGILGNAELALARPTADPSVRLLVQEIRDAGVRAAELARQILTYSGREPMLRQSVDLAELARDTLALLHASMPATTSLEVDPSVGLPFVDGDVTQLRQVLMNLLVNAGESLRPNGGDVRVRIERLTSSTSSDSAPADWIALDVVDTGAGMDAPTRARIFDPFFTTRSTGRGLGLAVVHGIVRAHGGTIEVESEPGRGTRMRVMLLAAATPAATRATPIAARSVPEVEGALVLVVDDERAVREVVRLTLESAGHRVLLAANSAEARSLVEEHGRLIDAIVLDLTLGPETSENLLAEIRASSAHVPVLVTSGYPEEEAMARLAALGVFAFVQKPFTPARLAAAVASALSQRKASDNR